MSHLQIVSLGFALFLLLSSFVGSSWEQQKATCKFTSQCRRGEICCKNVCATSCVGKYCRFSFQCGQLDKCCEQRCKKTCEGSRCYRNRNCGGKSFKCCARVCRKGSCLGSACDTTLSPHRTCGYNAIKRPLQCCGGNCSQSCQDRPCAENRDCGGWGVRMKCCDGVCKKSCLGSACSHCRDCHGLPCCGFFGSKICQRTCLNSECSMNEDCRDRRMTLWCCGDERCRRNCVGSVCHSETIMSDCAGPRVLFCCGIGQKKCRSDCRSVQCKTKDDCGPTFFYCGPPDHQNVSTCTENSHRIFRYVPLQ